MKKLKKYRIPFFLLFITLITIGHILNLSYEIPASDQRQNLAYAYNTLKYGIYSDKSNDEPRPNYRREPLYPLLLMTGMVVHPAVDLSTDDAKCMTLGKGKCIEKITYLKIINIIFLISCAILSGFITYKFTGSLVLSILCFLLISLSGSHSRYVSRFFSEIPSAFFLVLSSYLLTKLISTRYESKNAIMFGISIGLLTLIKPIFYYFILLCLGLLFIWWIKEGSNIKESFKKSILILISAYIIIGPWQLRNFLVFDTIAIAGRSDLVLSTRANINEHYINHNDYFSYLKCFPSNSWIRSKLKNKNIPMCKELDQRTFKQKAYDRRKEIKKKLNIKDPALQKVLVKEAKTRIMNNFVAHIIMTLPVALRGGFPEVGFYPGNKKHGTIGIEKYNYDISKYYISLKLLPSLFYILSLFTIFTYSLYFRRWNFFWFALPGTYCFFMYSFFTHFIPRYSSFLIPVLIICFCLFLGKLYRQISYKVIGLRSG